MARLNMQMEWKTRLCQVGEKLGYSHYFSSLLFLLFCISAPILWLTESANVLNIVLQPKDTQSWKRRKSSPKSRIKESNYVEPKTDKK